MNHSYAGTYLLVKAATQEHQIATRPPVSTWFAHRSLRITRPASAIVPLAIEPGGPRGRIAHQAETPAGSAQPDASQAGLAWVGGGLIASFKDKATEALFHGETGKATRRIPSTIRAVALRKLDMLNAAKEVGDLRAPGNRLEVLKGDLAGKHSIRINDQWRIVFRWEAGHAHEVWITDYH